MSQSLADEVANKTCGIKEAAKILNIHPVTMYNRASNFGIKVGKEWVFYIPNLENYLATGYLPFSVQGVPNKEVPNKCGKSKSAANSTKRSSRSQIIREYEEVLGLGTKRKRKK